MSASASLGLGADLHAAWYSRTVMPFLQRSNRSRHLLPNLFGFSETLTLMTDCVSPFQFDTAIRFLQEAIAICQTLCRCNPASHSFPDCPPSISARLAKPVAR